MQAESARNLTKLLEKRFQMNNSEEFAKALLRNCTLVIKLHIYVVVQYICNAKVRLSG